MSILSTAAVRRAAPRVAEPVPRRDDRPPLRLVEPPSSKPKVRMGLIGTVLLVALFVGIFALAAMHTLVVQAQFELDRLDQQVSERLGELDALRLDVARLESPAAITEAAREIGLVAPTERVYLEPVVTPVPDRSAPPGASPPDGDQAAGSPTEGR